MNATCYHCGKEIHGKCVRHVPPTYLVNLGLDFVKKFHPGCYAKEEAKAAAELGKATDMDVELSEREDEILAREAASECPYCGGVDGCLGGCRSPKELLSCDDFE